ncbi:MAG: hypothetical protein WKF77_22140, partial [Planctomycetaceae bacterium]
VDGKRLRFDDGRLVNNNLFQHADLNGNLVIDKKEFIERSYGSTNVADEFAKADADLNDQLTLDEWCAGPPRCMEDPVLDFLRFDTDLDGFVSEVELHKGVPEWKLPLARYMFPGFDENKDGRFTLTEFRQIIPENMVAHWYNGVTDADADERISLQEFQFDGCTCPLLRRLYFSRLDIDGSGVLEQSEFPFRIKQHDVFFSMNADGTCWKKLYEFEAHHACGSVTVSPDGKTLAFDSWAGDNQSGSALYTMDVNGGVPKQVCMGMMPSWSADGKSLAFSQSSQGSIPLTSPDGADRDGLANGWVYSSVPMASERPTHLARTFMQWNSPPAKRRFCLRAATILIGRSTGTQPGLRTERDCVSRAYELMELRKSLRSSQQEVNRT